MTDTAASPNREDALLAVARRLIWFEPPEQAARDLNRLFAYAMTIGTAGDMRVLLDLFGKEALVRAIDRCPPGIVDARSWAYWNLRIGRAQAPPLPVRRLPE
jgi:hypothetical protein